MTGARVRSPGGAGAATGLIGLAGLAALAAGLAALRTSDELGFDFGRAVDGVVSQLGVTLPAAAAGLGITTLELAAGLVLARLARRQPFDSLAEAAVAAMAAVVAKDAFVLGLLGGVGLFRGPLLAGIDVAIVALGLVGPGGRLLRPWLHAAWLEAASWRAGLSSRVSLGPVIVAALVGVVWLGPVVLQLASPVVPFIDVLPNYVAPAEHLRTFGWLSPLSATFSPIHGPSRSDLGYEALLGSLATIGNLPATLALATFILPSTLLVAAGTQRLATAVAGPGRPVGPWALLAFALTEPFARLGDARGTVIVLPLVALALALAAEACRGGEDRWRPARGLAMGVALGAGILLHPVIGAFATATVARAALARPDRLATDALVAGIVAIGFALPQAGIMAGIAVPPLALSLAIAAAVVVGLGLARLLERRSTASDAVVALARVLRVGAGAAFVAGVAIAGVLGALKLDRLPDGLAAGWSLVLDGCGVLLVAVALGWLAGSPATRSMVLAAAVVVGLAAAVVVQLLPSDLGFLGDALRFEVPKTVQYWLPVIVAVAAGPALAAALDRPRLPARLPFAVGAAAVGAIVVAAAFPVRTGPIDAFHLGEHRFAESLAIDLRWSGNGFWSGFPDSRQILDPPRRAIADAIRGEIDAGRIGPATPVLHVAASFQQWVSTPLGVFDGVAETFVSPDHEVSQQTVGGRLYGLESLDGFIASGAYPYVVVEPAGLPEAQAVEDRLAGAGYERAFSNIQGTIYRLAG